MPENLPEKPEPRRFPTFDVPSAAPVIPASRMERVIDEEGLF